MDKDWKIEIRKSTRDISNAINNHPKPGKYEWLTLAISGLGIIISAVAIFVAILIPKQIAEDQNKIALFEKRYEVYHEIKVINDFLDDYYYTYLDVTRVDNFPEELSPEGVLAENLTQEQREAIYFNTLWLGEIQINQYPNIDKTTVIVRQQAQKVGYASLLFDITEDEKMLCDKFFKSYNAMIDRYVILSKADFYKLSGKFDDSYERYDLTNVLEMMEKQMELYKN